MTYSTLKASVASLALLTGCAATPPSSNSSTPSSPPPALLAELNVREAGPAWSGLEQQSIRSKLNCHETFKWKYQEDKSGHLTYFGLSATAGAGRYLIVSEMASYAVEDGERVGYAVRLQAEINAKEAGVDIGSLPAIGAAVREARASGTLSLKILGTPDAPELLVFDLTSDGIARATAKQETAFEKLRDKGTTIRPVVLGSVQGGSRTAHRSIDRAALEFVSEFVSSGRTVAASQNVFPDRIRVLWQGDKDPDVLGYSVYGAFSDDDAVAYNDRDFYFQVSRDTHAFDLTEELINSRANEVWTREEKRLQFEPGRVCKIYVERRFRDEGRPDKTGHQNLVPTPAVGTVAHASVFNVPAGSSERGAGTGTSQRLVIRKHAAWVAPSAGLIYAHCGDGHSCEVLLATDRSRSTGLLGSNQSGVFPIRLGETAVVDSLGGSNPAEQVVIEFYPLR